MITATATISTTISSTENHNYAVPLLNLEDYRSDIWSGIGVASYYLYEQRNGRPEGHTLNELVAKRWNEMSK